MNTQPQMQPRACERVESYIEEFTDIDDINTVRRTFFTEGVDSAMAVAISIKYRNLKQKAAA